MQFFINYLTIVYALSNFLFFNVDNYSVYLTFFVPLIFLCEGEGVDQIDWFIHWCLTPNTQQYFSYILGRSDLDFRFSYYGQD